MTPIKRSRRLQAGLAGISVFSALGAAVGLGLTTRTHTSTQSGDGSATGHGSRQSRSHVSDDQGSSGQGSAPQQRTQRSTPVAPPSTSAPQATTSGS